MPGWYESNASRKQKASAQRESGGSSGQSATKPTLGFQTPGFPEVPVLPVTPIAPRTISIPRETWRPPRYGGQTEIPRKWKNWQTFNREVVKAQARRRAALQAAAEAERLRRLKMLRLARYGRATGIGIAFSIGWELGDAIYPWPFGYVEWESDAEGDPGTVVIPAGWTKFCDTSWPEQDIRYPSFGPCGESSGLVRDAGTGAEDDGSRINFSTIFIEPNEAHPTLETHWLAGSYVWAAGGSAPEESWPHVVPGTVTTTFPLGKPLPSEAPDLFPMLQPQHMPFPQKWADAVPKPDLQLGTGTALRGDYLLDDLSPPLVPLPAVIVAPDPDVTVDVPDVTITASANAPQGKVRWRVKTTARKRPRKRERQKKVLPKMAIVGTLVINGATEMQDFLEAMNEGLPKELRAKKKGKAVKPLPWDILAALWENFDAWDAKSALAAYVNNQVEDFAFGTIGSQKGKAARAANEATGMPGTPPSDFSQPGGHNDAAKQVDEYEPPKLPLPELKYDRETDSWELKLPWG